MNKIGVSFLCRVTSTRGRNPPALDLPALQEAQSSRRAGAEVPGDEVSSSFGKVAFGGRGHGLDQGTRPGRKAGAGRKKEVFNYECQEPAQAVR
jgi:hypothetical protein